MALSDLLLPIFVFPSTLFWFFSGKQDQAFCTVMLFIQYVSSFVSLENLVLIAVDRFGAVVFPLRSPLIGLRLCPFFILATWVVASALSCPTFFSFISVEYTGKFNCELVWKRALFEDSYLHAMPFVFMVISLALIIILYCAIVNKLRAQKPPGEQSVHAVKQREKRERNVLRMAVAIVTGFVVCLGPWNIFALLTVFVWDDATRLFCKIGRYWLITIFMGYVSCAINSCICFAFSGKYRQGLKGILGCH